MSKPRPDPTQKSKAPVLAALTSTRLLLLFLLRFVFIFGTLVAPWPGLEEAYGQAVRRSGQMIFGSVGSKGLARFRPNPDQTGRLDTVIYLGNREQLDGQKKRSRRRL